MTTETKTCNTCGEEKAASEFRPKKNICKACRCEYNRRYRQANQEKGRERCRRWRQANQKKVHQYRDANKEKLREYNRRYRQANKEKLREKRRRYRQANKEKLREYNRRYHQANKEKVSEQQRRYRQTNLEKIRQYYQVRQSELHDSYIVELIRAKTPLSPSQIPQSLIHAKREQLKLLRLCKTIKKTSASRAA